MCLYTMQSATNHQNSNDAHYDQVLRDLVDMATDIARMIHAQMARQASPQNQAAGPALPPNTDPTPGLTIAFDRISRTIRRTVLLAKKLPELGQERKPENSTLRRIADRKRIIRRVEDVIQRNAKPEHLEALQAEFCERLDSADLDDDIDHRPIEDIIADICRDLRVAIPFAPNYKRRTPAEVETLRTQAAAIPESWREEKPRLPCRNQSETPETPRRTANRRNLNAVGYAESRNREGMA